METALQEFWGLVLDVWSNGIYGFDVSRVLLGCTILIFFIVLRDLFSRIVVSRIRAFVNKTENTIDDAIVDTLEAPIRLVPVVLGVFLATSYLDLPESYMDMVANINRSLISFTIFWALFRATGPLAEMIESSGGRFLTVSMIGWVTKAMKGAFFLLGAATILEIWGIQVGPIIAGLGLFGVAVALGAQDLFKNLIAGLFILGEKRFHIGDWILIPGVVEGTVEDIGFRTTRVRRFDKAPVYVPNTKLADHAVTNFSRMTYRRIKWVIGVEYNTTEQQLRNIRQAIETYLSENKAFARPEETSTFVRIDHFADSSINILLYCFTNTTNWLEWLEVKEELLLKIKNIVEFNDANFAFPSQTLYVESLGDDVESFPKK
ncbi:mechanosensitive ion channel family protein [Temperatibacter marinus]|uniref:Mechanosensitive ion channel family protein n=1 Tax=Temperatibacter marinus TaxID=1456591 RepID=A0AA52EFR1_9PROT|nr:mechanosensitive ion channel family protein [Temperatibacter marinus]WND01699.1 mechanosensitive ion channel family protein [Temperatibacter marinus]